MSTTSPVQHALSIRELLFRIFSNSNTDSNAVNARVCKLWANEALSINSYSIDADALLNLLKLEGPQAWVRFDEYAWRVYVLSVGIDFDFPYILRGQILTTKFNRNRPLVPNLTTLTIDFDFDSVNDIIYLFESPSVRSLTLSPYIFDDLWMCSKPFEMALKILRSALVNIPSLRTLRVPEYRECEGGSIAVQAFASIIGEFDQLEEVQIPAFWLADPVVDSLASLPGLRSLDIPMPLSPSPALFTTIPPISDSYFPSLEALRMDTSFSKAIKWLSHPRFPKTLTSLSIHLRRNGVDRSVDCLAHLFAAIGSQLRNLRTLDFEEPSFHRFDASCSFESMRPLLSLSDLRHMTLKMRYTMIIDPDELVALFKALPHLECLQIRHSRAVDLSCLAEIAPIARRLEILELEWHTSEAPAILPRVRLPFARLRYLHGCLSCDLPPIRVAEFLKDVLPPECSIPTTWGVRSDSADPVRAAFLRVREEDRRRQGRAWAYIGPVGMGLQA